MIKWLLRGVVVFTILVVIALFVAMGQIDIAARSAIEKGGAHALGVSTTLDDIRVGILSGAVRMKTLQIGNPEGFETSHFVRLGDGTVAVKLGSLMEDLVVLPELTLLGIDMNLEKRDGKANYNVILDNLKKFQSDSPEEKAPPDEGIERKYVIRKVTLRDITVQADLLPVGGSLTRIPIKIDAIELENVGSDSDKALLLSELMGILTHAILTGIVEKAGNLIPSDMLHELSNALASVEGLAGASIKLVGDISQQAGQITKEVAKIADSVTGTVGNIGKSAEGIGSAVDDLGKNVDGVGESISEGVGGLLNLGKKKEQ